MCSQRSLHSLSSSHEMCYPWLSQIITAGLSGEQSTNIPPSLLPSPSRKHTFMRLVVMLNVLARCPLGSRHFQCPLRP
jgi:hypothetical protein